MDYSGQTIRMTDIQAKVENGKISIPLDVVKEKKMVRFEYEGNGVNIPLLAYITQTGKSGHSGQHVRTMPVHAISYQG